MQSVGGERNKYRHLILWLVQYGTRGKCPLLCCKDFFVAFLNCRFILNVLSSTEHFSTYLLRAITCNRPGTAEAWITESNLVGLLCVELHHRAFSSKAIRRKLYRPRHHRTGIRIGSWFTSIRRVRHFCSEWQWHRQWNRWHYWHKLHTVDWQYKLLTYCTCSPQVYRGPKWVMTEPPHII